MVLETPVVFLIFKRPTVTRKVFQAIRDAQPAQLFVVADSPRNEEEKILCMETRAITEYIDWPCKVHRNYSDINLGCRNRVSSGITWAFEYVEDAIILEDDCLPDASFFSYCHTLLHYYRNDTRIMVISGDNFQDGHSRTPYSYYFSRYSHCWGWATWKRAWKYWDFNPEKWLNFYKLGLMNYIFEDSSEIEYWTKTLNAVFIHKTLDSWATVWGFSCWSQNGLTILPNKNLVSNIGFGNDATHTSASNRFSNLATKSLMDISHPPFVVRHKLADAYTFEHFILGASIKTRILNKVFHLRLQLKTILRNILNKIKEIRL